MASAVTPWRQYVEVLTLSGQRPGPVPVLRSEHIPQENQHENQHSDQHPRRLRICTHRHFGDAQGQGRDRVGERQNPRNAPRSSEARAKWTGTACRIATGSTSRSKIEIVIRIGRTRRSRQVRGQRNLRPGTDERAGTESVSRTTAADGVRPEQRTRFMAQHQEKMQKRAKEKGVDLPDPPADDKED